MLLVGQLGDLQIHSVKLLLTMLLVGVLFLDGLLALLLLGLLIAMMAQLLKALAAGKPLESQKTYTPWGKAPILVPLGPLKGNSYLLIATFGDWVTKTMKGKDLFVAKYRKLLGYG